MPNLQAACLFFPTYPIISPPHPALSEHISCIADKLQGSHQNEGAEHKKTPQKVCQLVSCSN